MSASQAFHFPVHRSATAEENAGGVALASLESSLRHFGLAFCRITKTDASDIDWKPETARLLGLWMRLFHDLQVSDSGAALITAFLRLDTVAATATATGLLPKVVKDRMSARAQTCYDHIAETLTDASHANSLHVQMSFSVGNVTRMRSPGVAIH